MKILNVRLVVSSLVAVAITAGDLFIPDPADAAGGAMFRIRRTSHFGTVNTTPQGETYSDAFYFPNSEPNPNPPGSYPPATATFTPMGGFNFPRGVFHYGTAEFDAYTFSCVVGTCGAGYPVSIYYYSYYNYKGFFVPNNPFASTQTRTLGPRTVTDPTFMTTQFGNNYAFGRAGSISVTPGPNRFGGTMRYFWGENARGYRFVTNVPPCCEQSNFAAWRTGSDAYGVPTGMIDVTEYDDMFLGGTYIAIVGTRNHTYLTTGGSAMDLITRMTYAPRSTAAWTTGAIRVFQSGGLYVSSIEITGYDNRTENRELGTLSLVTPWLTHMYLAPYNELDPVEASFHSARVNKIRVTFLPEPGGLILLGAGILCLVGAFRLRRR